MEELNKLCWRSHKWEEDRTNSTTTLNVLEFLRQLDNISLPLFTKLSGKGHIFCGPLTLVGNLDKFLVIHLTIEATDKRIELFRSRLQSFFFSCSSRLATNRVFRKHLVL